MGEVPILTLSAHVFQIDPETKKKWLPTSQQAVNVSFYHDSSRNTYRIICIDDNKVLINCFVMPNMKFTKTAQKFGQWIDSQAATVYGLGFSSEGDLFKFADKFEEVKGLSAPSTSGNNRIVKSGESLATKPIPASKPSDATASTVTAAATTTTFLDNNHKQHHNSGSIGSSSSIEERTVNKLASQFQRQVNSTGSSGSQVNINNNSNGSQSAAQKQFLTTNDTRCKDVKCSNLVSLLRSENDRLKLELAQSSSKTREWEAELQQLRNSNVTLTTALEESRRNADEWQKQLDSYNDEIYEARKKLESLDSLTIQLSDARERLKETERLSSAKQEELIQLRQQFNDSRRIEIQNQKLTTKLLDVENENSKLKIQLKDLMAQLDQAKMFKKPTNHQKLQLLQEKISSHINELYAMNDQLADELQAFM